MKKDKDTQKQGQSDPTLSTERSLSSSSITTSTSSSASHVSFGTATTSSTSDSSSSISSVSPSGIKFKSHSQTKNDGLTKILKTNEKEESLESIEDTHNARIRIIKDVCSKKDLFTNMSYKGITSKSFYGSQNYNFTYCKVPKSGSTFWTRTFGVLEYGVNYGELMFKLARNKVHSKNGRFVKSIDKVIKEQSRTILVSRDPFSRLFSAYIDKSFLFLMTKLNFIIRDIPNEEITTKKSCPTDLTFEDFLDWIITTGKGGKSLNSHWAPIFSLCLPCAVNSFILVKQETFGQDVEYALKKVGVEKEKLDYIAQALHDHRAELSLPGIIDTLFIKTNNSVTRNCLDYMKYSRRIWISLQIQGFIDEHAKFPVEKFNQTNLGNSTYCTQIVLQTIRDFPMTSKQKKEQRHRYLYKAYEAIKPETIQGIQELYKQDFELFEYSNLPPTQSREIK